MNQGLETQPKSTTRVESRGATAMDVPVVYPLISLTDLASYGSDPLNKELDHGNNFVAQRSVYSNLIR
jgi:hypothetical protein